VTLPDTNGNNSSHNLCGYLPAMGSVFRFMDGYYPLNLPKELAASDNSFRSEHAGASGFLFADGSVRNLVETIHSSVYQALGTRAAGDLALP
jgi:prepilin-type processing-associated H-X9-DG protein